LLRDALLSRHQACGGRFNLPACNGSSSKEIKINWLLSIFSMVALGGSGVKYEVSSIVLVALNTTEISENFCNNINQR
jgi:hypothetical protein